MVLLESVNMVAKTLKFGIEHPWAHWLRLRKIQFEGPCEDPVLAIEGPCFAISRKAATGYTQQCKIFHGTSLGTIIKFKEDPI